MKDLDLSQIRRNTVAERDYWIDQLRREVLRLRAESATQRGQSDAAQAREGASDVPCLGCNRCGELRMFERLFVDALHVWKDSDSRCGGRFVKGYANVSSFAPLEHPQVSAEREEDSNG
jgi:ribosomal protein L29